MAKITIPDINADYAATSSINDAFDSIETAIENTLSRDGTTPNSMSAELDMSSNDINNARNVNCDNVIAGGQTLVPSSVVAIDTASSVPNVAAGNIVATDVQAAINELDTEKASIVYVDTATASRGCLVYHSANQTVPDSTYFHLSFDSEDYDTDAIHDIVTNNQRLVVPDGVTKIRLTAQLSWAGGTAGRREVFISKNDDAANPTGGVGMPNVFIDTSTASGTSQIAHSPVIRVNAGDFFTVCALQTSGSGQFAFSATNYETWFAMEIIE